MTIFPPSFEPPENPSIDSVPFYLNLFKN